VTLATTIFSKQHTVTLTNQGIDMKYGRFVNEFMGAAGINSEVANEAELDRYFCDISPVEQAAMLASIDPSIDAQSLSLLMQGNWRGVGSGVELRAAR